MTNIKTSKPTEQAKAETVRRTRGRNYYASLRLEGFSVPTNHISTVTTDSYKEEIIAKYRQLTS